MLFASWGILDILYRRKTSVIMKKNPIIQRNIGIEAIGCRFDEASLDIDNYASELGDDTVKILC